MEYTKKNPTIEGYYWVGQHAMNGFSADIRYAMEDCDENDEEAMHWAVDSDDMIEPQPITEDSPNTWYYGPITHPTPIPPK